MPAKRIIILDKPNGGNDARAALWADVPAGNQIAYADPAAVSQYANATPGELQEIRSGLVAEKIVTFNYPGNGVPLTVMQTDLQAQWTAFQNEVTAIAPWGDFGRFWDNSAVWQAATGVPSAAFKEVTEGLPGYVMVTAVSAFAANKCHFLLWNNAPIATSQKQKIQIRKVIFLPHNAAVTGAVSGPWTLQRRTGGTAPAGGTAIAAAATDSAQIAPAGISIANGATIGTGGTLRIFNSMIPPADEVKPATLDSPTMASLQDFGGIVIWQDTPGVRPLTIRPGETLELVQDATAGTGNCRILVIATVG